MLGRKASLASRAWQLILDPEYKDHDLLDKEGQRQARQRITLLVHRENLALQDVDRDGHCQYHAFREAARNAGHTVTDWSTDNLRNTVVAGARGILGALGDAYAAEVENEAAAGVGVQNVGAAAWGDEGSITVLARAYLVRVRVLDERSGYVTYYGPAVPQAGKRTATLLRRGNHYQWYRPPGPAAAVGAAVGVAGGAVGAGVVGAAGSVGAVGAGGAGGAGIGAGGRAAPRPPVPIPAAAGAAAGRAGGRGGEPDAKERKLQLDGGKLQLDDEILMVTLSDEEEG